MSDWVMLCAEKDRDAAMCAVRSVDEGALVTCAASADELRYRVATSELGELGVIVGPTQGGVSDVNLAAALAGDGNARCVILVRDGVSGSLRSRAARAGIDLVVDLADLTPGTGAEISEKCGDGGRQLLSTAAPVPIAPTATEGERAPILVACSGRGGVGKTTLMAAASCVAARWGMRVCLVDLDLSCGNARGCFGVNGKSDLALTSEGIDAALLGRLCVSAGPGVSVVGPCERPETAELAAPHAGSLLVCASGEFDLVLVDTSTTFTEAVAQAAQLADRLLIVSDGRAGSVSSLARMSGLAIRLGVARTRIARIENRADPRDKVNHALGRAEVGLEAARVFRVLDGGREVSDLMAAGQAHDLAEPGYPFADSVASTLAQLLAELGRLPECEEARRASEGESSRGLRSLFGLRREAR